MKANTGSQPRSAWLDRAGRWSRWRVEGKGRQPKGQIMSSEINATEGGRSPASAGSVPSDTERLMWLQHHMKGSEMRRLGIVMNWTGDTEEFRQKIDEKLAQNDQDDQSGHV